jgi:hypothetical protein
MKKSEATPVGNGLEKQEIIKPANSEETGGKEKDFDLKPGSVDKQQDAERREEILRSLDGELEQPVPFEYHDEKPLMEKFIEENGSKHLRGVMSESFKYGLKRPELSDIAWDIHHERATKLDKIGAVIVAPILGMTATLLPSAIPEFLASSSSSAGMALAIGVVGPVIMTIYVGNVVYKMFKTPKNEIAFKNAFGKTIDEVILGNNKATE